MDFFIETSYVIASIIITKSKHNMERYATVRETNLLKQTLQDEFNKRNLNAWITRDVDREYFDTYEGLYIPKKGISDSTLEKRYQGYCTIDILKVLWDDEFIYHKLQIINGKIEKKLPFEPMQIDKILNKILENPRRFYEQIACELSSEEYQFITKLIEDRTCQNCFNSDCKVEICEKTGINEFGRKQGSECTFWRNDELVGRRKILTQNTNKKSRS